MRNYDIRPLSERLNPVLSAILFLIIALAGFVIIGPGLGTVVVLFFYEGGMMDFLEKLQSPFDDPGFKNYLFSLQGFATGVGLLLIPIIYLKASTGKKIGALSPVKKLIPSTLIMTLIIVIAFVVVNSLFIEWNSNMELPEALSGMEEWMRQSEQQAAKLTEYMTTFDSTAQFLIAILVIAILPAIGEELVFRGLIQTELTAGLKNPHVAIWLSAIIFSAIHLQFFGFIPRMLLGALFGYLYYWSGNLAYPIIAHFINNAGQLILLYFVQKGVSDIDMESTESFPPLVIIAFSFITFGLLFYFRRLHGADR